ncbi:protein EI24 homolog isoform X2 [Juglans regia]|uniref:Protein EI24 homolog isoform X2 n=1 Tax=Juglans regia TaxID=51240 RepID=A0A6P9E8X7_JUGRE|nr:protein EI24 homolog isoform X2 [Juglans regia]
MEATKPSMKLCGTKLKQTTLLWLEGFIEACCLHRVVILCLRSRKLLIRTGQCFLLNGFIFLGSIFVLNSVVIPMLQWILPDQCSHINSQLPCSFDGILKFYSILRRGVVQLFYIFWFYPMYVFSIILSNIWYNDIAKFGFAAMGRSGPSRVEPTSPSETSTIQNTVHAERLAGLGGVMVGIGEQVYSVLLLSFFFLEGLYLMWGKYSISYSYPGCMPTTVSNTNGTFLKWLWTKGCITSNLTGHFSLVLFVLSATGSRAEQEISFQNTKWRAAGLGRLPIFYAADTLSLLALSLLPLESRAQMQENKAH